MKTMQTRRAPAGEARRRTDERNAWRSYVRGGRRDEALRDHLIAQHFDRLRQLAEVVLRTLVGSALEVDELVSAGWEGLRRAAASYDPEREASYWSYASIRARGSMIDYVREIAPRSRVDLRIAKQVKEFAAAHYTAHGRAPTVEETVDVLGVSAADIERSLLRCESIDRAHATGFDRELPVRDLLTELACEDVLSIESEDRIRDMCRGLSLDETVIVHLRFSHGTKMKTIGEALGLSESRISQKMAAILARLGGAARTAVARETYDP